MDKRRTVAMALSAVLGLAVAVAGSPPVAATPPIAATPPVAASVARVHGVAASTSVALNAPTAGGWPSFRAPGYQGGDINGDGDTDTTDLRLLSARIGSNRSSPDWSTIAAYDVASSTVADGTVDDGTGGSGGDGTIDIADVAALSRKIVYSTAPLEIVEASVLDMQKALNSGVLTSVQLTQRYLDRIDADDPSLDSLITVNPDALELAAARDAERAATGSRGMLDGIPVIVKDNIDAVGMPTTAGCTCLRFNFTASDSTIVAKLREQGAVILAKSNLSEFALNTDTLSSLGGQTKNPYLLTQTPGGSSGGTGASIAASFGAVGLGTDTGGSIRIPASYNNLVGIRPTLGLTSRTGIVPLALSQDTAGPMARTVTDAALALDAIAGDDAADPATAESLGHIPASYTASLDAGALVGARIGRIREAESADPAVHRLTDAAVSALEAAGATVVDLSLPDFGTLSGFRGGATNEFAIELDAYLASEATDPRVPYSTLQQIVAAGDHGQNLGLRALSEVTTQQSREGIAQHAKDQQSVRDALTVVMAENGVTALLYPSTESTASGAAGKNNRLSALSGYPAISVPMGFATADDGPTARAGTPANIELLGAAWSEPTLIGYAYAYEQASRERKAPALFPRLAAGAE